MSARFHRSTREAFAWERYPSLFGPYRRPTARVWAALKIAVTLALLAVIAAVLFVAWSAM